MVKTKERHRVVQDNIIIIIAGITYTKNNTKDYKVCKAIKCLPTDDPNGIEPVKDAWTNQQIGYHYKVIGTTYTATCDNKPNSKPCGSNARRRSLLQDEYGNCGERL